MTLPTRCAADESAAVQSGDDSSFQIQQPGGSHSERHSISTRFSLFREYQSKRVVHLKNRVKTKNLSDLEGAHLTPRLSLSKCHQRSVGVAVQDVLVVRGSVSVSLGSSHGWRP